MPNLTQVWYEMMYYKQLDKEPTFLKSLENFEKIISENTLCENELRRGSGEKLKI